MIHPSQSLSLATDGKAFNLNLDDLQDVSSERLVQNFVSLHYGAYHGDKMLQREKEDLWIGSTPNLKAEAIQVVLAGAEKHRSQTHFHDIVAMCTCVRQKDK